MNIEDIKITFADVNELLVDEWKKQSVWDFYLGNILDLECDAVLTPGNSFGYMTGGVDAVFVGKFGLKIQKNVQDLIKKEDGKELLVGRSVVVETGDSKIRNLIYSPTMRIPARIADPVSVYLAVRSGIKLALDIGCSSIVLPGFGTSTGMLKYDWAVSMMVAGIEDVINPKEFPKSLRDAHDWHYSAYPKQE